MPNFFGTFLKFASPSVLCYTTAMSDAGSQFPHLSVEGLIFPFPIHAQFAKLPPTRSTFPPDQFHGTKELFSQYSFSVIERWDGWQAG